MEENEIRIIKKRSLLREESFGVLFFENESHVLLRCIRNKVHLRFSWLGG